MTRGEGVIHYMVQEVCSEKALNKTLPLSLAALVFSLLWLWTFLVAQTVKNLPAMQETWVQSLSQEDPLEEETATPVFSPGESHGL